VFHRIFVQGNASPYCNPKGGFGLTCEITYSTHKPLPVEGDALIQRCIEDCHKVGISGRTIRCGPRRNATCLMHMWSTTTAAGRRWREFGVAGRSRYPAGGPVQRVGVLQFRPCFPGGKKAADRVRERESEALLSTLVAASPTLAEWVATKDRWETNPKPLMHARFLGYVSFESTKLISFKPLMLSGLGSFPVHGKGRVGGPPHISYDTHRFSGSERLAAVRKLTKSHAVISLKK